MTREEALEQAIYLSKTTHSICLDSERFWDHVISALSAEQLKLYTEPAGTWKKEIHLDETWSRIRYVCPICGDWNTHGESKHCPKCGVMLNKEGKEND